MSFYCNKYVTIINLSSCGERSTRNKTKHHCPARKEYCAGVNLDIHHFSGCGWDQRMRKIFANRICSFLEVFSRCFLYILNSTYFHCPYFARCIYFCPFIAFLNLKLYFCVFTRDSSDFVRHGFRHSNALVWIVRQFSLENSYREWFLFGFIWPCRVLCYADFLYRHRSVSGKYSKTRLLRIPRDLPFKFALSVICTKHITNFNEMVGKLRSIRVDIEIYY